MPAFHLPPNIDAILFDKDGTLIDYHASWGPINLEVAEIAAAGVPGLALKLRTIGGIDPNTGITMADSLFAASNTREIAAGLVAGGSPVPHAELTETLDALFATSVDRAVPVVDLGAFFSQLRFANIAIGIASSDNERSIRATVDKLGLGDAVEFISGYDSGHGAKPDPAIVHAFCKAVGTRPERTGMVGDNGHDMHMGRAAGVALKIAVLTGTGTRETLSPLADVCLNSIAEINVSRRDRD